MVNESTMYSTLCMYVLYSMYYDNEIVLLRLYNNNNNNLYFTE